MTILCLASYEKGHEFLREAKRQGCRVLLLTSLSLQGKAEWPAAHIDEIFYMPDQDHAWNRADTIKAVSYLARTRAIDRIVALDDFDVEMAAALREHLRLPGMGETTVRHFRDKLAMRMRAREAGINVPDFVPVVNYEGLRRFMESTPAPWVLKPRSMAGAIGIKKIHQADELWPAIEFLGDMQSFYLLEQFIAGDIFHVDCIVSEKQVVFAIASGYGRPPMEVSHAGGIFTTGILQRESDDALRLVAENQRVMAALGMVRGVSHTEFIKARADGRIHFLETSARVGGAHIVELVEAATGLNLWAEWAKVEVAGADGGYRPPVPNQDYAGLLISLARQEHPDTSAYNDAEIVWRLAQRHHAGLIVKSPSSERVRELLAAYERRFAEDFYAYQPPRDKPSQ
ncbi:MAG: ATP-grasp domain-containing protein [Candidatus Solibacter sp.]|nr:ATP-grasp domain-containing protein [Candidatus Solibacter sp.]